VTKIRQEPQHLHKLDLKKLPKEYLQVAEGMETQFADLMIKEMKKSVNSESEASSAENYYNSLLDYERAKTMTENGEGLGIKQVVLRQILPQHLHQRALVRPNKNQVSHYDQIQMGNKIKE
jgi:Rod binding domain-containing protein